jgi:hypothetical protein
MSKNLVTVVGEQPLSPMLAVRYLDPDQMLFVGARRNRSSGGSSRRYARHWRKGDVDRIPGWVWSARLARELAPFGRRRPASMALNAPGPIGILLNKEECFSH